MIEATPKRQPWYLAFTEQRQVIFLNILNKNQNEIWSRKFISKKVLKIKLVYNRYYLRAIIKRFDSDRIIFLNGFEPIVRAPYRKTQSLIPSQTHPKLIPNPSSSQRISYLICISWKVFLSLRIYFQLTEKEMFYNLSVYSSNWFQGGFFHFWIN